MSAAVFATARNGRHPAELPEIERRRVMRFFERNPMLDGLSGVRLQALLQKVLILQVRRRKPVWNPGEPSDYVYFVRSGVVRMSQMTESGRELILGFSPKGTLLGAEAVLTDGQHESSAVAHEDLVLYALHKDDFTSLMRLNPEVCLRVTEAMARYRRRLDRRVAGLVYKSAPSRLAALFLELAEDFGVSDSRGVILNLKLTHRELGALVGVTRETASFVILDMRKEGIIENERKRVVLRDLELLGQIASSHDGTFTRAKKAS
jgi:CRP/FNR family transcriptional regulator